MDLTSISRKVLFAAHSRIRATATATGKQSRFPKNRDSFLQPFQIGSFHDTPELSTTSPTKRSKDLLILCTSSLENPQQAGYRIAEAKLSPANNRSWPSSNPRDRKIRSTGTRSFQGSLQSCPSK